MNSKRLSEYIKAEARSLGFFACGMAKAEPVDEATANSFKRWIGRGDNADMAYMENYTDKRLDPRLLVDGVKTIVSLALNYAPANRIPNGEYQFAVYAYGQDYHEVVKQKLRLLAQRVKSFDASIECREFCDTAPVLERYWAVKAGIGWTGRNHQLIIPNAGSMFFLGELFINVELPADAPATNRCGHCHACIDACPTQAICATDADFHAERCLSYLTIENRNAIPEAAQKAMNGTIYGCDRCQQACPWNRFSSPTTEPLLQPKQELLDMRKSDWDTLSIDDYRRLFKGSAVKRAKYEGLMRNIKAAKGDVTLL